MGNGNVWGQGSYSLKEILTVRGKKYGTYTWIVTYKA